MRRSLLVIVTALVLFLLSTSSASAFGLKDVLQMHKDGIADSLIIQKIEYSRKTFRLDAGDMRDLKEAGVSDEVISTMLRTENRGDDEDYYDYPRGYAYDDYYYPHTRLYLGFGLGGYYPHGWYYGGYRYPRHYRYYSPRYYRTYDHRRYYFHRGNTGYRTPTGQWGGTRYRGQVGERIYSGNRPRAGYRERTGPAHPGTGVRTRRR